MCKSQKLGFISAKYESGKTGCATVSTGANDPGGVSYGMYQLSSKAGTLLDFLSHSGYAPQFDKLKPGTEDFRHKWLELATQPAFCNAQHNYICDTHYMPVANYYKNTVADFECEAVDEALWSMAVQHSYKGCCRIIDASEQLITDNFVDEDAVNALYKARSDYISNLSTLPEVTKEAILNRYKHELADVLKLI